MVNQQLVDYIKKQEADGFTSEQLYNSLTKQGINQKEVIEAIAISHKYTKYQPPAQHNNQTTMLTVAAVLILAVGAGAFFFISNAMKPECGNGIIEEGETPETCCADTGCKGDQTCDTACIDPVCGTCQYLQDHVCQDYECCSNDECLDSEVCGSNYCVDLNCDTCQYAQGHQCINYACCRDEDCGLDQTCQNHECSSLQCSLCQYIENNACINYECCSVADCDDNNLNTTEICINPGTIDSKCTNPIIEECYEHRDCDDNNTGTRDLCAGDPKICYNQEISKCEEGDNFCPPGCNHIYDDDCNVSLINCTNMNCFTDASEECGPAVVLYSEKTESSRLVVYTDSVLEMDEGTNCELTAYMYNINIELSDDLKELMEDNGSLDTEIRAKEIYLNNTLQNRTGWGIRCDMQIPAITDFLDLFDTHDADIACLVELNASFCFPYCEDFKKRICPKTNLVIGHSIQIDDKSVGLNEIYSDDSINISVDNTVEIIEEDEEKDVNGVLIMNTGNMNNNTAILEINCQ